MKPVPPLQSCSGGFTIYCVEKYGKTQVVDFTAKNAYNKLDKMDKYGR